MQSVPQRLEHDLARYPGMLADETVVWRAWLRLHEAEYVRFEYNIRLGPDQDPGPAFLPEVRRNVILNHKLRIDAVGWREIQNDLLPPIIESPAEIYRTFPSAIAEIIEVKRRATNSAIGEAVSYLAHWLENWPSNPHPRVRLVAAAYAQTILAAVAAHGILLDPIAVDFSILRNPPKPTVGT
jgi:hypothetical protein